MKKCSLILLLQQYTKLLPKSHTKIFPSFNFLTRRSKIDNYSLSFCCPFTTRSKVKASLEAIPPLSIPFKVNTFFTILQLGFLSLSDFFWVQTGWEHWIVDCSVQSFDWSETSRQWQSKSDTSCTSLICSTFWFFVCSSSSRNCWMVYWVRSLSRIIFWQFY